MKDLLKKVVRGERTREYVFDIGVKILWKTKEFPQNKIMITNYVLALEDNSKVANLKTSVKFSSMDDAGQLIKNLIFAYCVVRRDNELKTIRDPTIINMTKEAIKSMLNKSVDDAFAYTIDPTEVKNEISVSRN